MAAVKKRRLADLFVVKKSVTIDDGSGGVSFVVRKMNAVDQEAAFRLAGAARTRVHAVRSDPQSDAYQAIYSEALDMDRNTKIEFLLMNKLDEERKIIEAQVGAEDEWAKDGYLQSLYDAWSEGLDRKYALDPEDVEAKKIFDEMKRYESQVADLVASAELDLRPSFESRSDDDLCKEMTDQLIKSQADFAWLNEYRRAQVLFMIYDLDGRRYFNNRSEVDDLASETLGRLIHECESLEVPVSEGKDSEETQGSLNSSESPEVSAVE